MPYRMLSMWTGHYTFLTILSILSHPVPALAVDSFSPSETPDTLAYRGTATDLESGRPEFTEHHREARIDGKVAALQTRYLDPEGRPIAERTLDFTRSPYLPRFRVEDFRTGAVEASEMYGDWVKLSYREKAGRPMKVKLLAVPAPAVVDGGFSAFLKSRWDELARGERITFHVVVPSRQAYYVFVAYEDRKASRPGAKVVVAEPRSSLLRLLAPRIEVTYDEGTRRIRRFRGISNISKADGAGFQAEIRYPGTGP